MAGLVVQASDRRGGPLPLVPRSQAPAASIKCRSKGGPLALPLEVVVVEALLVKGSPSLAMSMPRPWGTAEVGSPLKLGTW